MVKIEFQITPKWVAKIILTIVWLAVLGILSYTSWGLYVIDRAMTAFSIFVGITIVVLIIGIALIVLSLRKPRRNI
jgi:hypothetical protein